jgi:hypothetical protein
VVGDDQYGEAWFGEWNDIALRDGEVNRQGTAAVFVSDWDKLSDNVRIMRMTQPMPAAPEQCLWVAPSPEAGTFSSPSFSPDGNSIAVEDNQGVWVVRNLDLTNCNGESESINIVPGGHSPDWGPADVPVAPAQPGPVDPKAPQSPPAPQVTPPAPKKPLAPAGLQLQIVVKKAKAAKVLATGLPVLVRSGRAGIVTAVARLGKTRVGSGTARIGTSGSGRVVVRFTKKAKRTLRRGGTLRIAVTFRPSTGGGAQSARTSVRIGR